MVRRKILSVLLTAALILQLAPFGTGVTSATGGVPDGVSVSIADIFPDSVFAAWVVTQLSAATDISYTPTDEELAGITSCSFISSSLSDWTGLEYLTGLTYLNLYNNRSINEDIRNFPDTLINLTNLNLSNTGISGNIRDFPSILTNLTSLNLYGTNIGGDIRDFPNILTNLTSLNLVYTDINGDIADFPNTLTNLTNLDLTGTNIGGDICDFPNTLINLTNLILNRTNIGGNIRDFPNTLTNLTSLDLVYTDIYGDIVDFPNTLTNLTNLDLAFTNIGGDIADFPSALTNLTSLSLPFTDIDGDIADFPSVLINLTELHLGSMNIGGDIRDFPSVFTNLTFLALSGTNIGGDIKDFPNTLINLTQLNLQDTNIGGDIGDFPETLTKLEFLYLNNTKIGGDFGNFPKTLLPKFAYFGLYNLSVNLPEITFTDAPIAVDVPVKGMQHEPIAPENLSQGGSYANGMVTWQIPAAASGVLSYNFTTEGSIGFKNFGYSGTVYQPFTVPGYTDTSSTYVVTFKDHDGTTLKTETVSHGALAIAPQVPPREGHTFTGWDTLFTNVTQDITVTAQYTVNTYTVIFKDHDGTTLKTETVDYGGFATAPPDPARIGYVFTGWDSDFDNVTADLSVTAGYRLSDDTTIIIDKSDDYSFANGEVNGDIIINCNDAHIDNLVLHGNLYVTGKNIYIWGLYVDGDVELRSTGSVTIWGGYSTSGYNNYGGYEGDVSFGNKISLVTGWNRNLNTIAGNLKAYGTSVTVGGWGYSMNVDRDLDIYANTSDFGYVTVKGTTRVNGEVKNGSAYFNNGSYPNMGIYGGGGNSIHINDAAVENLEVNKVLKDSSDEPVRVVFEGDTAVASAMIKSSAGVENTSANAEVRKLTIASDDSITLSGAIKAVEINAAAQITLAEDAKIETLTITKDAAGLAISGDGEVKTAIVSKALNASSVLSNISVGKTETLSDNDGTGNNKPPTGGGGGGYAAPAQTTDADRPDPSPTDTSSRTTPSSPSAVYGDVPQGAWFGTAVEFVSARGIMGGSGNAGTFRPEQTMTRAMLITALARCGGIDTSVGETWYSAAVAWGTANGVTDGANLTGAVTREQIVTMLWRQAGRPRGGASFEGVPDAAGIGSWAADAFKWAMEAGIISGYGDKTVRPQNNATRAETAVMLHRFIEATE
jgi:hypothetical protein